MGPIFFASSLIVLYIIQECAIRASSIFLYFV